MRGTGTIRRRLSPSSVRTCRGAGWWVTAGITDYAGRRLMRCGDESTPRARGTSAVAATSFAAHVLATGRARATRTLVVRRPRPGRFTLGQLDGRLLASEPQSHVAVIAPTRSGKTTRYVIPWLLEHDGPAVVTSTKTDVVPQRANTASGTAR